MVGVLGLNVSDKVAGGMAVATTVMVPENAGPLVIGTANVPTAVPEGDPAGKLVPDNVISDIVCPAVVIVIGAVASGAMAELVGVAVIMIEYDAELWIPLVTILVPLRRNALAFVPPSEYVPANAGVDGDISTLMDATCVPSGAPAVKLGLVGDVVTEDMVCVGDVAVIVIVAVVTGGIALLVGVAVIVML